MDAGCFLSFSSGKEFWFSKAAVVGSSWYKFTPILTCYNGQAPPSGEALQRGFSFGGGKFYQNASPFRCGEYATQSPQASISIFRMVNFRSHLDQQMIHHSPNPAHHQLLFQLLFLHKQVFPPNLEFQECPRILVPPQR